MGPSRALGRGLGDVFADTLGSRRTLALTNIEPNPRQPRQGLVEAELEGLAASISRYGVLQPIVVSERADHPGRYYLVAGERRWRAAGMAGLTAVPASIVTVDDRRQLELALVENLQRSDLSPLDRSHRLSSAHGRIWPNAGSGGGSVGCEPLGRGQRPAPAQP